MESHKSVLVKAPVRITMMAVEKKPLEKNRNLLGQKQRKVSKSNKQICSPAYGNGPPLFPTGVKTKHIHH